MAKIVWALICKETAFTPSGDVVINGEFSVLNAKNLPDQAPTFYILSRFTGNPGEVIKFKLRVIEPNGKDIVEHQGEVLEVAADGFGLLTLQMEQVIFPIYGKYRVELFIDNVKHTLPLVLAPMQ